ncbi:MAG: TspO/MBR family protein [Phycisphaerales bacterium]
MSKQMAVIGLMAFLAVTAVAPVVGGMATASSVDSAWFRGLAKPRWNPPGWVFGPVWTVLYVLMAVAAWTVWKKLAQAGAPGSGGGAVVWSWSMWVPMGLYAAQLALNLVWSVIFFGMRELGWALAEIVVLWAMIALTTVVFARVSAGAAWMMSPYLAWVSFAAVLNFSIWRMNG